MSSQATITRRSLLLHGLRLVLRSPGALLWTYGLNLALALMSSIALRARLDGVLAHSLESQRLTTGFDLGVLITALTRMDRDTPTTGMAWLVVPVLYLVVFFLLTPGTLVSYRTGTSSRLTALLSNGLQFAGRFLLIVLLTAVVCGVVLGLLFAGYSAWASHVREIAVGNLQLWLTWPVLALVLLVASMLRLYFDLVEAYTVALAEETFPSGRPDRRIWRVLLPAARTLVHNFGRATGTFVLLSALGLGAVVLFGTWAVHTLARPGTLALFLLTQVGLFLMMFTRFWQRGMETILVEDFPLPLPAVRGSGPVQHPYLSPERRPLPPVPDFDRASALPPPLPIAGESS